MNLIPLPAFQDNDLWLLHDGRRGLVVDPGDAQPVLHRLQRDGLQLEAILVTHHHPDHIGGVGTLRDANGRRHGRADARIAGCVRRPVREYPGVLHTCVHMSILDFAPAAEPGNRKLINYI